ncbi:MAG TPA: LanC-like protein [Gaiellaceae bacterium]
MPLFDPESHEALTDAPWDEARVRAAIAAIVADAEAAFDERTLWLSHPLDDDEELPPLTALYMGASGMIWALDELRRLGLAELTRSWASVAVELCDRYRADPDEWHEPIPSLWFGEAGILLVAHRLAPAGSQEEQLFATVEANAQNPTRELAWGSPGTMLAAQEMHDRTGDERWAEAWRESADWLWEEWRDDLWAQEIRDRTRHYVGPAHGFVGNVLVLARDDLLDDERRAELERRTVAALAAHGERDGDLAQWPPTLESKVGGDGKRRTQWCHGAPGIVASVGALASSDDELTELLVAGGELTWRAGPLAKGPGLCHGTAGNGYAFLKLFERTGDELWLERARAFAIHALEQVERARAEHGRGRYTLWTGDVGTALYLAGCVAVDAAVPTLDRW